MTILYILLFIVCLSTLIMVHEAGHLLTAKIFKVYCFEYAIGFGPRLFSFKRKNGETRYSLRAIPFGGFVSMYGEADAVPEEFEGVQIDPNRSINNIKHWKRGIILTAGILMNFILALVVFFIYEMAFPAYTLRVGHIIIKDNTIAHAAGLRSNDWVSTPILGYNNANYVFYDSDATVTFLDSTSEQAYVGFNYSQMTLKDQTVASRAVAFKRIDYGEITTPSSEYSQISYQDALNGDYRGTDINKVIVQGFIQTFKFDLKREKVGDHDEDKLYLILEISEHYTDKENFLTIYKQIENTTREDSEFDIFYKYVPYSELITVVGDMETEVGSDDKFNNKLHIFEYETAYPFVKDNDNLLKQTNRNPDRVNFAMNVVEKGRPDSTLGEHSISVNVVEGNLGDKDNELGVAMQIDWADNSFGTAVGNTFKDFGNSTTAIFRGLGGLFTKDGWKNVGGIIAIGVMTTNTLEQNGFGLFIYYWAMISVNLGIVNLLPFPGLDGWQFIVTIVEGVAHKEIPPKVKNTVSAIGIMLLFALMILIVIKDIIMVV